MEERDISKCCSLQYQTQYTQQILINGVPQNSGAIQVPDLTCPNCNNIIAQFTAGTSMEQMFAACENELQKQIHYCVKCVQKLEFPKLIVITAENETN